MDNKTTQASSSKSAGPSTGYSSTPSSLSVTSEYQPVNSQTNLIGNSQDIGLTNLAESSQKKLWTKWPSVIPNPFLKKQELPYIDEEDTGICFEVAANTELKLDQDEEPIKIVS